MPNTLFSRGRPVSMKELLDDWLVPRMYVIEQFGRELAGEASFGFGITKCSILEFIEAYLGYGMSETCGLVGVVVGLSRKAPMNEPIPRAKKMNARITSFPFLPSNTELSDNGSKLVLFNWPHFPIFLSSLSRKYSETKILTTSGTVASNGVLRVRYRLSFL